MSLVLLQHAMPCLVDITGRSALSRREINGGVDLEERGSGGRDWEEKRETAVSIEDTGKKCMPKVLCNLLQ